MAEVADGPHSIECSKATSEICVCQCRGTLHGIAAPHSNRKLRRLADVAAANGRHLTPAARRAHPVNVARPRPLSPARAAEARKPQGLTHVASLDDTELMAALHAAAVRNDQHDARHIWDELGRREAAAAPKPYNLSRPVDGMTDDELAQAFHDASQSQPHPDTDRALRTIDAEQVRREDAQIAREAEAAKAPTAPVIPAGGTPMTWMSLAQKASSEAYAGDPRMQERLTVASRLALGLPADATAEQEKTALAHDPMGTSERYGWALAWYQKLADREGVSPTDTAHYGPAHDEHAAVQIANGFAESRVNRATAIAAEAAKVQAQTDRAAHDAERRAAIAAGPAHPAALVRSPVAEWASVLDFANIYRGRGNGRDAGDRIRQAQTHVLGLPDGADESLIRAAERADHRSLPQRTAEYLAWYRHITSHSGHQTEPTSLELGQPDQPGARAPGPRLTPATVAKPWAEWQKIQATAVAERKAGDSSTYDRYRQAMLDAYGIAHDGSDQEITRTFRADTRTENQKAADFLAHFRQLAGAAGIDSADASHYGPQDRGGARKLATQWAPSTPDQERRIDALVAKGHSYLDAYAQVHDVDPQQLQAAAGRSTIHRGAGETTARAMRREYDVHVHTQYVAAERATSGHLLSRAGIAAGVDPVSLFSGPIATARKYASEELLRWWHDNGSRMTFTQYRAQITGSSVDRAAARVTVMAGNGKDFG